MRFPITLALVLSITGLGLARSLPAILPDSPSRYGYSPGELADIDHERNLGLSESQIQQRHPPHILRPQPKADGAAAGTKADDFASTTEKTTVDDSNPRAGTMSPEQRLRLLQALRQGSERAKLVGQLSWNEAQEQETGFRDF